VQPRAGVALVKTEIQPKFWNKIHVRTDATGLLRPRTGLKDMFIELDPGGHGQEVKSGYHIPVENTAPDIDPDEILSAFDTDTRSYLQLLINGAGKGFKNRGSDFNAILKALGPTQHDLNRVTSAVAARRVALKELIHRYGDLTNTLADKDREIRTLVTASDAVFRAFASQSNNISAAVAKLPATLAQTETTLNKANAYAQLLRPTLNDLRPPFRQLDATNQEVLPFVREAAPILRNKIRPFVRTARPTVNNLRPAAIDLARATPDFASSFHELNRFFNMAAFNPGGAQPVTGNPVADQKRDEGFLYWASWVAETTDSMFSTSDANGSFRRALLGLSCDTIKNQIAGNPAAGPLIGLSNAINDPVLCGNNAGSSTPGLPIIQLPKGAKGKTSNVPAATQHDIKTSGANGKDPNSQSGGPAEGTR
jgi:phospholipid/cholesterol/gamma-HCH transport system substrate-binding protein